MKEKVLIHYRHFPVAIGRYFHFALIDLGYDVRSFGHYDNGKIPWGNGSEFYYPEYAYPPDLAVDERTTTQEYDIKEVLSFFKEKQGFVPDIIIQASDVTHMSGKCDPINVVIGTDPHVVDMNPRIENADFFFCMQDYYRKNFKHKNNYWLPYAYYEGIHKNLKKDREYDVVFVGLQYGHRVEVMNKLKDSGVKVFNGLGLVYDKFNEIYNDSKIAFNYSSKQDLPARFWEGLAMGCCVVTNDVPDLDLVASEFDIRDNEHYMSFDNAEDAVVKIKYLLNNPKVMEAIAKKGHEAVITGRHRYRDRVEFIMEKCLR